MFLGRVVGTVWSTVKWKGLEGVKFLVVRPYHLSDLIPEVSCPPGFSNEDGVVVADILGAGVGEDVIIAYGHSARVALEPHLKDGQLPSRPVDAAVVAIVDQYEANAQPGFDARAKPGEKKTRLATSAKSSRKKK
jgi:ethanolamine utilization protein EutN